jgi:hypothetical protein
MMLGNSSNSSVICITSIKGGQLIEHIPHCSKPGYLNCKFIRMATSKLKYNRMLSLLLPHVVKV